MSKIGLSNDISPTDELSITIALSADTDFLTALSFPSTTESVGSWEVNCDSNSAALFLNDYLSVGCLSRSAECWAFSKPAVSFLSPKLIERSNF